MGSDSKRQARVAGEPKGHARVKAGTEDAMIPIDELREALLMQRRQLLERVAHTEEDLLWLDTHVAAESTEEGQEENIARLLARLDDLGRAEIEAIDLALARMASGDYGSCEACGERIPLERLRALPTAVRCLGCARALP
jgi:DnaK suppressor protein